MANTVHILGISAYYHDSAAALVRDGRLIGAAQEERFSRVKHDPGFPAEAVRYCLEAGQVSLPDIAKIVFYDKPILKFDRLIETYLAHAPGGFRSFSAAMPVWLKEKLFLENLLQKELAVIAGCKADEVPTLLFTRHHQAHAAAAFFPSPFDEAAILCLDGVGEWATSSLWHGKHNELAPLAELHFPHSLGLLYSAFTYYTGFKVNSGEYKLMGLAPYGQPVYVNLILDNLVDLKADGSFRLNMRYFDYMTGFRMVSKRFEELFGQPARTPADPISQRDMDVARSIQEVTEEIVLRLARTLHGRLNTDRLCLAGGVALNCVVNGRLVREGPFRELWVQPAAGDAGGALGAALSAWYEYLGNPRQVNGTDSMQGAFLGPSYADQNSLDMLERVGANYVHYSDGQLFPTVAKLLDEGQVVGWFQGRMEFGPRALGGRSILADPRDPEMKDRINNKIKFRESFRPFAPAVKVERVAEWFQLDRPSPYMLLAAPVTADGRERLPAGEARPAGRSPLPSITHVDSSARIQTVHQEINPRFYGLLEAFEALTGCPVLLNTSFNVRGEPIVNTPRDAWRCFMRTGMDYLVLGNYLLDKTLQPAAESSLDLTTGDPADPRKDSGPDISYTKRQVRIFGSTLGLALPLLFGIGLPAYRGLPWPLWPWIVGGLPAILAWIAPAFLWPVYRSWMLVGRALGKVNTRLVLGVFFFLILSPVGLVMRLLGRDPLARGLDPEAESYLLPGPENPPHSMERPF